jgi:RHS repeat-associated protein
MEYDLETGTYHTLNRQYESGFGRWLTADPAGKDAAHLDNPQTWNMYAYVTNNPMTLTDPSGLGWLSWTYQALLDQFLQTDVKEPPPPPPIATPPPPAPHIEYKQGDGGGRKAGDTSVKIGTVEIVHLGIGYAGHGQGLNNPANEGVEENYADPKKSNAGPLPRGDYTIGPIGDHTVHDQNGRPVTLGNSMRLTPVPGATDPVDRSGGYLIHGGDYVHKNSSQGCPVENPAVRGAIGNSGIHELEVVQ